MRKIIVSIVITVSMLCVFTTSNCYSTTISRSFTGTLTSIVVSGGLSTYKNSVSSLLPGGRVSAKYDYDDKDTADVMDDTIKVGVDVIGYGNVTLDGYSGNHMEWSLNGSPPDLHVVSSDNILPNVVMDDLDLWYEHPGDQTTVGVTFNALGGFGSIEGFGSVTSHVDPKFYVPSGYSLAFELKSVPEPQTLLLFGLGLASLLGVSRFRSNGL